MAENVESRYGSEILQVSEDRGGRVQSSSGVAGKNAVPETRVQPRGGTHGASGGESVLLQEQRHLLHRDPQEQSPPVRRRCPRLQATRGLQRQRYYVHRRGR